MEAVAALAKKVNAQGRTMGMALTSCTVPMAGKPTFDLGEDEMEIGIGIHGEPGRRRVKLASANEITEMLATVEGLRSLPAPDEHAPAHDFDYLTNFERKFRQQGKPIFRASYERTLVAV